MAIPNWLHLSQNSGNSGETTVTITADTYSSLTIRTANLTVKSNLNTAVTKTVSIIQEGYDYSSEYLTFNITSNGTIKWKTQGSSFTTTISYSKDDGNTWTSITSTTAGTNINVSVGDKILFKGENAGYYDNDNHISNSFSDSTAQFEIEGNIMSLLYGDNFTGQATLQSTHTFDGLFNSCYGLTSAEKIVLPARTLTNSCYQMMFSNCTGLTTAPAILPATTLANNCYHTMFGYCSKLTTTPILLATTLAFGCYMYMFRYCSSLTTAPELPATTLASFCYHTMFEGCTSLTTAPVLPATTLPNSCYASMFNGCSSLNYIKCLATDISATGCTGNWVNGVSSTGTFVKDASMTGWTTGNSGIPSGWTVQDAT